VGLRDVQGGGAPLRIAELQVEVRTVAALGIAVAPAGGRATAQINLNQGALHGELGEPGEILKERCA